MLYKRFSFYKKKGIVNPIDGDLLILNGQTVSVAEGSVKQYRNIQINTGGVLQITGTTGAWTEIGCSGDCIVNGQIIARAGYDGQATHNGGSFTKTSAFGIGTLSYSVAQQNGGTGGNGSGVTASAGRGGLQANGIGGGGAGGGPGGNGGAGGLNGQSSNAYPGGTGGGLGNGGNSINDGSNAYPRGGNGASGGGGGLYTSSSGKISIETAYGGGGAGAYKGHHGKGLTLYVEGALSGIGSIICSGRAGFVGGAGVDFSGTGGADGGGGGGGAGGAGGSGGSLILKYGSLVSTPSISVAGGAGGAGGAGNNAAGATGSSGLNGSYSLSSI
jgi:hypothetical protein